MSAGSFDVRPDPAPASRPLILSRLEMRRFKGFPDRTLAFSEGLNVIAGPNETGKSTIQLALATVLFGNPQSTARERDEWRTWGHERLPELVLHLRAEGQPYVLRKDFETRGLLLTHETTGERWETRADVEAKVTAWLGFGSAPVFRTVAFIDQVAMAGITAASKSIEDSLSRIVTGGSGDADIEEVLRHLERVLGDLERGLDRPAPKNPGAIAKLRDEIRELMSRRDDLARQSRQYEDNAAQLEQLRQGLERSESEVAAKRRLLETNLAMQRAAADAERFHGDERRLGDLVRKIDENLLRLQQVDRDLAPLSTGAAVHEEAYLDLVKAEEAVNQKTEMARRSEIETEEAERRLPTPGSARRPFFPAGAAFVGGIVIVAAGVALAALRVGWGAGLALVAVGAAAAVWGYLARRSADEAAAQTRGRVEAARGARQRAEEARGAAEDAQREFQTRLAYFGSETLDELGKQHRLRQERARLASQVESLLAGTTREALDEQYRKVQRDLAAIEHQLDDPASRSSRLEPLAFQKLQQEVGTLEAATEELRTRKARLEGLVEGMRSAYEEVASVEERLADLQERLRRQQQRLRVLQETRAGLEAARQQTIMPTGAVLEELTSGYLAQVTRGRYTRVRVEEGGLRFLVHVGGAKEWAAPEELSRGAQDQCYLAARLALVRVLAQGRRPPVVLDDPFVTFDDEREAAAMAMVAELARDGQVLLFTSRRRTVPDGAALLWLDARTARQPVP